MALYRGIGTVNAGSSGSSSSELAIVFPDKETVSYAVLLLENDELLGAWRWPMVAISYRSDDRSLGATEVVSPTTVPSSSLSCS
jgi:hypothetical protein